MLMVARPTNTSVFVIVRPIMLASHHVSPHFELLRVVHLNAEHALFWLLTTVEATLSSSL